MKCMFYALVLILAIAATAMPAAKAAEDPAVTEARELARQQFELEKAKRATEEAKKKLAEEEARRRAIALTKMGLVSVYNPTTSTQGFIAVSNRWKMWDGSMSEWETYKIGDKKVHCFVKLGGISMQIKFSSTGGGEKLNNLESIQAPNDAKFTSEDGKQYQFSWGENSNLNLFTGKPKNW